MRPCLPFATALPHVHGGIPAWGILSGACWARSDDPRNVGQQRLAERRQRRIQIRHREGRRRIVLLLCQSRPITVTSRKKVSAPSGTRRAFSSTRSANGVGGVKGIPDPPADPTGAAPAGVTAHVPAGIPLVVASNLGRLGGDAIVEAVRKSTTDRRGDPRRLLSTNQPTIGKPATRCGCGHGRNPLLLHQKM